MLATKDVGPQGAVGLVLHIRTTDVTFTVGSAVRHGGVLTIR